MAKKESEAKKSNFLKEMKSELKKVVWPTKKELFNNTSAVITFVIIIAVIVFALDFCFDLFNKYGIVKLQEKVHASIQLNDNSINVDEENAIEIDNIETTVESNSISVNTVENTSE